MVNPFYSQKEKLIDLDAAFYNLPPDYALKNFRKNFEK